MIKSNWNYLFILIALAVLSAGCQKVRDLNIAPNDVSGLLTELKDQAQTFTGTAGSNWTLIGAKGTRIHFTSNSFKNSGGSLITSGNIEIKLIETPKATDMILNSVSTLSTQNELLQSGGSINIQATQNGQRVYPGEYSIDFKQDASSTDTMQLFTQNEANGIVTWNTATGQNTPTVGTFVDSGRYYFGLTNISSFNWINCDYFYKDPSPRTDVTIEIEGANFVLGELAAFIVLPEINANTYMRNKSQTEFRKLHLGNSYKLPIGMKAHFVVLGMHDNKKYYGELKNQTISNNFSTKITLSETNVSNMKWAINNL